MSETASSKDNYGDKKRLYIILTSVVLLILIIFILFFSPLGNILFNTQAEPEIKLVLVEMPFLDEDGDRYYFHIEALVKGNPEPIVHFNRNDQLDELAPNISVIILEPGGVFTLEATAVNPVGTARTSMVLTADDSHIAELIEDALSDDEDAFGTPVPSESGSESTLPLPIINSFEASPGTITIGGSSALSWNILDAASVSIDHGVGDVNLVGNTSVSPTSTTTYTLTATNDAGSVAVTKQVNVTGSLPPTEEPDLIVSSLTHSPASPTTTDQITFTAVVKNIGTGPADPSKLSLKVGGGSPQKYNVPALAPGATHIVQRQVTLGIAQNYLITAVADVDDDVAESNEANNEKTLAITVVIAGEPDLIVSSLTHSPASPTTTDQITFTAVVKNIGTGPAGPSKLSLKVGGGSPQKYNVPALAPGATHVVQRQVTLGIAQNYLITAVADVDDDVAESNEANNEKTLAITVQ